MHCAITQQQKTLLHFYSFTIILNESIMCAPLFNMLTPCCFQDPPVFRCLWLSQALQQPYSNSRARKFSRPFPSASPATLSLSRSYAAESTQDFVDRDSAAPLPPRITSFASAGTAHALARAALARSVCLLTSQASDIGELAMLKGACGIGSTASIASKSWKRGGHRLFVALSDCERDLSFSVDLYKVCACCIPRHHLVFYAALHLPRPRDVRALSPRRSARGSRRTICAAR
jgi:hypothetical protein